MDQKAEKERYGGSQGNHEGEQLADDPLAKRRERK